MRILLLNDNPVVRKLVALSAQKTKDDLQVVWSVDEIEHPSYDLLIVDDAHYSEEAMDQLKQKITYKTSLLMSTRGNAVPEGFDKVINKPFLPTDLVDMFAMIEKSLPSEESVIKEETASPTIDLDALEDDLLDTFDTTDDDLDLSVPKTGVFDEDEVQELQSLLDDTDDEGMVLDDFDLDDMLEDAHKIAQDEIEVNGLDELKLDDDDHLSLPDDLLSDFEEDQEDDADFTLDELTLDDTLDENDDAALSSLDKAELDDDLLEDFDELESSIESKETDIADDLSELLMDDDDLSETIEEDGVEELLDAPLSDDEFDDLELQIQNAIGDLGIEDLESDADELDIQEMELETIPSDEGGLDTLDDLDTLDEKEIKLAIGEEVEEELDIRVGSGEHSSLDAEALNEAMGKTPLTYPEESFEMDEPKTLNQEEKSPAEGIEALQALLKALANDEVAKSLKGLNINININFGNDK